MTTVEATSLSPAEQRAVDRFVRLLTAQLGDELLAVWLFGSRARGEPVGDADSDVDLLVITRTGDQERLVSDLARQARCEGEWAHPLHALTHDPGWVAERRGVNAFLMREIDSVRVVLYGSEGGEFGERVAFRRHEDGTVSERTEEYLRDARGALAMARAGLEIGEQNQAIARAYDAMFLMARAALSEEDRFARTHDGTWHLHHDLLVKPGRFPADLHRRARTAEKWQYQVDYESGRYTFDQGRETVELAERFLAATVELLGNS